MNELLLASLLLCRAFSPILTKTFNIYRQKELGEDVQSLHLLLGLLLSKVSKLLPSASICPAAEVPPALLPHPHCLLALLFEAWTVLGSLSFAQGAQLNATLIFIPKFQVLSLAGGGVLFSLRAKPSCWASICPHSLGRRGQLVRVVITTNEQRF